MSIDPEILRNLILRLERRQLSPRSTVVIEAKAEADVLEVDETTIIASLNWLQYLGYIEGPGEEDDGIWLFRKLTAKGRQFAIATLNPRDWEDIKVQYK